MKTIREIYRIGYGPSSSHTMGPRKASELFLERHPEAAAFEVTLYGSLAATGRGHLTDVAILDTLRPHAPVEIVWKPSVFLPFHPNGMTFRSKNSQGEVTDEWTVFSIGGGALAEEGKELDASPELYAMNSMTEILNWCERTGRSYWEYVQECEDSEIWNYLSEVWTVMRQAIERGLDQEGVLPGPLNLRRKASSYYIKAKGYKDSLKSRGLGLCLCAGRERGECLGRPHCHGTYLWVVRCGACRAVSLAAEPRFQRHAHLAGSGHGWPGGKYRETECLDFGSRGGVSGRGRCGLRHGVGIGQPAVWR